MPCSRSGADPRSCAARGASLLLAGPCRRGNDLAEDWSRLETNTAVEAPPLEDAAELGDQGVGATTMRLAQPQPVRVQDAGWIAQG